MRDEINRLVLCNTCRDAEGIWSIALQERICQGCRDKMLAHLDAGRNLAKMRGGNAWRRHDAVTQDLKAIKFPTTGERDEVLHLEALGYAAGTLIAWGFVVGILAIAITGFLTLAA